MFYCSAGAIKASCSPREPLPAGEGFPVGIGQEVTSCSIPNLHPKAAPQGALIDAHLGVRAPTSPEMQPVLLYSNEAQG